MTVQPRLHCARDNNEKHQPIERQPRSVNVQTPAGSLAILEANQAEPIAIMFWRNKCRTTTQIKTGYS